MSVRASIRHSETSCRNVISPSKREGKGCWRDSFDAPIVQSEASDINQRRWQYGQSPGIARKIIQMNSIIAKYREIKEDNPLRIAYSKRKENMVTNYNTDTLNDCPKSTFRTVWGGRDTSRRLTSPECKVTWVLKQFVQIFANLLIFWSLTYCLFQI